MSERKGFQQKIGQIFEQMLEEVRRIVDGERGPLTTSIMGQTGVGKSSLINALLDTDLPVNPVGPGTIAIEKRTVHDKSGHEVIFYDLPGIGESQQKDEEYIRQYTRKLQESDVVIWAVLAESRSFIYDRDVLDKIISKLDTDEQRVGLMSKIVFVLTKVDLLTDPHSSAPWTLANFGDDTSVFETDLAMENLIKEKEVYFREAFISPFRQFIKGQTYHKGSFHVSIPGIHREEDIIYYEGFLEESQRDEWIKQYPKYTRVFERLYDHYRTIPCSARFRYNLDMLANVIIGKLGTRSTGRLEGFVKQEAMNKVPYSRAKHYNNMIIFDKVRNQVFDLSKLGG